MTEIIRQFTPDWISPFGDTIEDLLEERDWTQAQLAEQMGYTIQHVSQLIHGKAQITEETALKLEQVLGSTAEFWLTREAQYRAQLAKAEEKRLQKWVSGLEEHPVKPFMNKAVIPECR